MTDTWTPSSPIVIGGAGAWAAGPWKTNSDGIHTPNGSGKRLVHGDSDYIELAAGHAAATHVIGPNVPYADASFSTPGESAGGLPTLTFSAPLSNAAIVPSCGARVMGASSGFVGGARLLWPLRVHQGGTIEILGFAFAVADPHSGGVPHSLPKFRAYALASDGTVTNLCTNTATTGWAGNGYVQIVLPAGTPGSTWYAGGALQSFVYPVDAGTVIDQSKYAYIAEVVDESGANAMPGNVYTPPGCIFNAIPDLRPQ